MNKPLLTTVLSRGIGRLKMIAILLCFPIWSEVSAQPCGNPSPLTGVPGIACVGDHDTLLINPYFGASSYQLLVSPAIGVIINNLTPGFPGFEIFYTLPGNYELIFRRDIACADTFNVHVSSRFAPQVDCNDKIHFSLDENCAGFVYPSLILEGIYDSLDYIVVIKDKITNLPIQSSPYLNASHIGKEFIVEVIHVCSGNTCWGYMLVEDKLKPRLECETYTIDCDEEYEPEDIGFPMPAGAPNPTRIGVQRYRSTNSLVDNCGPTIITYSDRIVHADCPPPILYIDTVFRDWIATDSYGNEFTCTDTILIRVGDIGAITCPLNYDGFQNPILLCENRQKQAIFGAIAWNALPNGHPSPYDSLNSNGSVKYQGTGLPSFATCRNLDFTFTDIRLNVCPGTFKILREWIVADWCTGRQTTCIQVIKVEDQNGPQIVCGDNITISTLPNTCEGEAILNIPTVFTECSTVSWVVKVKRGADLNTPPSAIEATTAGVLKLNNTQYQIFNLPVGLSWVLFIGNDGCGNADTCATEVFVEEKTRPIAVCDLETVVTLTDAGSAKVYAITFDDGSHDNCEMGYFKVRRMNPGNCPDPIKDDSLYGDFVEFCCNDIPNNPLTVVLQVVDKAGNTNECMVRVTVQDKKPPVVTCLPDITISCEFDKANLFVFGSYRTAEFDRRPIVLYDPTYTRYAQPRHWGYDGLVIEDCNLHVDSSVDNNLNSCGLGTIERKFAFYDDFSINNKQRCTQKITVVDSTPFDGKNLIVWPDHIETHACHADISPDITGKPSWPSNLTCSNIIATSEDQVFNIVENVCFKILRTWTVVDWCLYNSSTGKGRWTYTQVIKIKNSINPHFITPCSDLFFESTNSDCNGFATLFAEASDDCLPAQLLYNYEIDLNNDGSVEFSSIGSNASGTYPVGTHRIKWTVIDQCGNSATCIRRFTIIDRKLPTPVCQTGLITVIMPSSGQVTIWANSFDHGSRDNCTPNNKLRFAFSANPNNVTRTFTCPQIEGGVVDTFDVSIFVFDEAGNADYCDTKVIIQDGLGNACPDNLGGGNTGNLAGAIFNEANSKLENAMVTLNANMPNMPKYEITQVDGQYAFVGLPLNENYTITAQKDDDPLNGVTTQDIVFIQRHILGLQNLNSPYKVIAADINNSASITAKDVSDLRKLILGITNQFPDNKSWKFVSATQKFNDSNNPWPFNEKSVIDKLSNDKMDNNFIAIKMGDVSGNARTSNLQNVEQRTKKSFVLDVEDLDFVARQQVRIPVTAGQTGVLSGMQLAFNYEASVLQFNGIESGVIPIDDANYMHDFATQRIKLSWDQVIPLQENQILFYLVFDALKRSKLNGNLVLASDFLAEAYTEQLDELNIEFRFKDENGSTKGFYLYQNQPNPFNAVTKIKFNIPVDGEVRLTIMDVNGKLIRKIVNHYKSGLNSVEIKREDLSRTGLLYYQLEMGDYKSVRKMLLIE
ncbi:MAG: hypothetical protein IPM92_07345 [Saprospiraceae bacterium]|nr:hypothetical protein [Saprospiraceae bacterium]